MNDEVRKMLEEAKKNVSEKCLKNEVITFANAAATNTAVIYREIYRLIIADYTKHPTLGMSGAYTKGYTAEINITGASLRKIDILNELYYTNTLGDLALAYNKQDGHNIVFYVSPNAGQLMGTCFDLTLLTKKLQEDGFTVTSSNQSTIVYSIDANKFRDLLDNSIKGKVR